MALRKARGQAAHQGLHLRGKSWIEHEGGLELLAQRQLLMLRPYEAVQSLGKVARSQSCLPGSAHAQCAMGQAWH